MQEYEPNYHEEPPIPDPFAGMPDDQEFEDAIGRILDDEVIPMNEAVDRNAPEVPRIRTGFTDFDDVIEGGFKGGDLIIISGISGEGKTTYGQSLTFNMCKNGVHTVWFSYEVTLEHLDKKFQRMGIDPFYNVYVPKKNTTGKLQWVKDKIVEARGKYEATVVFIDHLDFLIPTDVKTTDNRTIELQKIVTELKEIAIKQNVAIITMAHVKKLPDYKEPEMQDIAHSGAIFQLADYVFLVWRIKQESRGGAAGSRNNPTGDLATNRTVVKLVKNRSTGRLIYVYCNHVNERFIKEPLHYDGVEAEPARPGVHTEIPDL